MSIVIFLDFDGVLHRDGAPIDEYFCKNHLVEEVLRAFPEVCVVISSSWKDFHSLDEIQSFFSADVQARIIGVTPSLKKPSDQWLPGHASDYERQWEIETWMKKNRNRDDIWIAIDDRPYWFREDCPWLICTDGLFGFTEDDAKRLTKLIQKWIEP